MLHTAYNSQTGHAYVVVMQINDYGFYVNLMLTEQHALLKFIYLFLNHLPHIQPQHLLFVCLHQKII